MGTVKDLLGKTITKIEQIKDYDLIVELIFHCSNGKKYRMHHIQDCCESVYLADIIGDINDLIGFPILKAEEAVSEGVTPLGITVPVDGCLDSFTWTFYKFATKKGYVDLRWLGESNGYYSESVDFEKIDR